MFHADNYKVSLYKTEADHDHLDEGIRGIDDNVKKCIEELYNDGIMKPKQIIRALQARNLKMPTTILRVSTNKELPRRVSIYFKILSGGLKICIN